MTGDEIVQLPSFRMLRLGRRRRIDFQRQRQRGAVEAAVIGSGNGVAKLKDVERHGSGIRYLSPPFKRSIDPRQTRPGIVVVAQSEAA